MAIVRYSLEAGKELSFEEEQLIRKRIEEAAKRPYTYDPDCPLLTEEQLAEFRPVHFATWEERAQAMREAGITDKALVEEMAGEAVELNN